MLVYHYVSLIVLLIMIGCGASGISDPTHLDLTTKLDGRFQHEPSDYLSGKLKRIRRDTLQAYYDELVKLAPTRDSKLRASYDATCTALKKELEKTADADGFLAK